MFTFAGLVELGRPSSSWHPLGVHKTRGARSSGAAVYLDRLSCVSLDSLFIFNQSWEGEGQGLYALTFRQHRCISIGSCFAFCEFTLGWILGRHGTGRCCPSLHLVRSSGMSCNRDDKEGKLTSMLSVVPGGSGGFCVLRGSPGGTKWKFRTGTLHSIILVVIVVSPGQRMASLNLWDLPDTRLWFLVSGLFARWALTSHISFSSLRSHGSDHVGHHVGSPTHESGPVVPQESMV